MWNDWWIYLNRKKADTTTYDNLKRKSYEGNIQKYEKIKDRGKPRKKTSRNKRRRKVHFDDDKQKKTKSKLNKSLSSDERRRRRFSAQDRKGFPQHTKISKKNSVDSVRSCGNMLSRISKSLFFASFPRWNEKKERKKKSAKSLCCDVSCVRVVLICAKPIQGSQWCVKWFEL